MLSQTYALFGELSMLFLVLFTFYLFYSLLDWVLACLWVSHNRIMDIACSLCPIPQVRLSAVRRGQSYLGSEDPFILFVWLWKGSVNYWVLPNYIIDTRG